jgi:hypothetical protein
MSIARITCALAVALFIGGQALAQGGPQVTVVNTPLPVTALGGAPTPVGFSALYTVPFETVIYSVPPGSQLVIEYVSGICHPSNSPFNSFAIPSISVSTSGVVNIHTFGNFAPVVPPNQTQTPFGHLVKIYADPGTSVVLEGVGCSLAFSGQLVPHK